MRTQTLTTSSLKSTQRIRQNTIIEQSGVARNKQICARGWVGIILCKTTDSIYFKYCATIHGDSNGTPLQYSCLENPVDGGAWWAAVHGVAELDMTEQLHSHFSLSCTGEGNGNPLQCSCLENPRDGGAWWAAVYGVAQSRTRLKRLSCSSELTPDSQ